jgi:hypothetical protein
MGKLAGYVILEPLINFGVRTQLATKSTRFSTNYFWYQIFLGAEPREAVRRLAVGRCGYDVASESVAKTI